MPQIPVDVVVAAKEGAIDAEVKRLLELYQKGNIQLTLGIEKSQLSTLRAEIDAVRAQSLFDVKKAKAELSDIGKALDEIAAKASKIKLGNLSGSAKASLPQLLGPSGLPIDTTSVTKATETYTKFGDKIDSVTKSLANLAARKKVDLGDLLGTGSGDLDKFIAKVDQVKSKLVASPQFQTKTLINENADIQKIVDKFEKQSAGGELIGQLLKGTQGRVAERLKAAQNLADEKNIPGLGAALTQSVLSQQANNSLPKLINPANLANPVVGAQVARGAIFGGASGFAGGLIGGLTPFGQAGALVGAQLIQAVEHLLDPVVEAAKEKAEEYRASGTALAQSILSIQSVLQSNTTVVSANGAPTTNIGASLAFQERRATEIQTAARAKLLPLGIGGQTEATFVRGIVSALAQRGITPDANQTANIARALAGLIQTQRPQLLENPALLNRDLQDVLSGLPQAKRTILGSLLRDAIPDLAKANDAAGIEKALASKQIFADVAGVSDNFSAVQHRLEGAKEAVNTAGGQSFLEAQKGSLKFETEITKLDIITKANEDFGELAGTVEGVTRSLGALGTLGLAASFELVADSARGLAKVLGSLNILDTSAFAKSLSKLEDNVNRTIASSSKGTDKTEIARLIESTGLKDRVDKFHTDLTTSPEAQLAAIAAIQKRFGSAKDFNETAPALFDAQATSIAARDKRRQELFGDSDEGRFNKASITLKDTIPDQQKAFDSEATALGKQLNEASGKIGNLNKQRADLDKRIADAQLQVDLDRGKGGAFTPQNRNKLLAEAFSRAGNQVFPQETDELGIGTTIQAVERAARAKLKLPGTVEAGEHEASLRELKQQRANVADNPEIGQLTAQFIDAERQSLALSQKRLELIQEESNIILSRVGKIRGSFDETTAQGSKASADAIASDLDKSLSKQNFADKIIGTTQSQIGSQIQTFQGLLKNTTNPDQKQQLEKSIDDLKSFSDQQNENKKRNDADIRNVEAQRLAALDARNRAQLIPIDERLGGVNSQTLAGQTLGADITGQRAQKQIDLNNAIINQLRSKTGISGAEKERDDEFIEKKLAENRVAQVTKANSDFAKTQGPLRGAEEQSQLNIATRNLSSSFTEEKQKRDELNASLRVSVESLLLFENTLKQSARAAALGKEEQLLSISDQIGDLSGDDGPLARVSEEERKRLKLASLTNQFNLLARQSGSNESASGGDFGLGIVPDQTPLAKAQSDKEQFSLRSQITNNQKELGSLADTFSAARKKIEQEIAKFKFELNGAAEPGVELAGPPKPKPDVAYQTSREAEDKFFEDTRLGNPRTKAEDQGEFSIDGEEVSPQLRPFANETQRTFPGLNVPIGQPIDPALRQYNDQRAAEIAAASVGVNGDFRGEGNVSDKNREAASELFRFGSDADKETSGSRNPSGVVTPRPADAGAFGPVISAIEKVGEAIKTQFSTQTKSTMQLHPDAINAIKTATADGVANGLSR